jgi:hypothetical protein
MMCAGVFRQIKVQSFPKIICNILVPLIFKVEVSMPLEIQVDISAPLVLKIVF